MAESRASKTKSRTLVWKDDEGDTGEARIVKNRLQLTLAISNGDEYITQVMRPKEAIELAEFIMRHAPELE